MQRVAFFELDRTIQERFVESVRGAGAPVPLATEIASGPVSTYAWAGLGLLSAVGLWSINRLGYGQLHSPFAILPKNLLYAEVGLGAILALSVLKTVASRFRIQLLPYKPGLYLFPSSVVDARTPDMVVYRIEDNQQVTQDRRYVSLQFDEKTSFTFRLPDEAHAQKIKEILTEVKDRLSGDAAPFSSREHAALDPLLDNGFRNPLGTTDRMKRRIPWWDRIAPLLGLLISAPIAWGLWAARNHSSESRIYLSAVSQNTTTAYREYLERTPGRTEIREVYLPRSELREAIGVGSVEAIERYIAAHPHSKIQAEADLSLNQALEQQFQIAKAQNTISAFRAFLEKHGQYSSFRTRAEKAIEDIVEASLARFAAKAKTPQLAELFRKLVAEARRHDGVVEIRFRPRLAPTIERTTTQISHSAMYTGPSSLPGQYFDAKRAADFEQEFVTSLVRSLREFFPQDLLEFRTAEPLADDSDDIPDFKLPTLFVAHRTEISGCFTSKKPRLAYAGVGISYKLVLTLPGDKDPFIFKDAYWRIPDIQPLLDGKTIGAIYEELGHDAFRRFAKHTHSALFSEPPR